MTTRKRDVRLPHDDYVTSAGVPLRDVPEAARQDVEWMEGVHGSAADALPPEEEVPVPDALVALPELHPDRPRGSKAMLDVHGARARLRDCRPGGWLVSPFTGHKWAKWPSGHIGWVPKRVDMPIELRIHSRNDSV